MTHAVDVDDGRVAHRRGRLRLPRALPHLAGRRGTIVGGVYLALLALTLIIVGGFTVTNAIASFRDTPATSRFGFSLSTGYWNTMVAAATPAAKAQGLKFGDQVVAVNGIAVPADASVLAVGGLVAAHAGGPSLRLKVKGADEPDREIVLAARPRVWLASDPWSGLPLWLATLFNAFDQGSVFLIAASALLYRRRANDPEAMLFACAFLLSIWSRATLAWVPLGADVLILLPHLGSFGLILISVAIAAFPDGRFVSLPARLAALIAVFLELLLLGARISNGGPFPMWVLYPFEYLYSLITCLAGLALLLRYRRITDGIQRQQIKWAVAGFAVAVFVNLLQYLFEGWFDYPPGPISGLTVMSLNLLRDYALPLGLLVSLLRYRLYDAERAIGWSVSYGLLTIALVALFAGFEKVIELLGEEYFGERLGALAGGLGAAMAAVMIVPLHHRISHWTEHRFQKRLIHLRHGLPALVGDLRETEGLETIGAAVVEQAGHGVRAQRAAMLAGDELVGLHGASEQEVADWRKTRTPGPGRPLDCERADPLFPVRVPLAMDEDAVPAGWLLLGARPDGSLYGKAERAALAEIAEPIARAVHTVRRRQDREERHELRMAAIEATLGRTADALETLRAAVLDRGKTV